MQDYLDHSPLAPQRLGDMVAEQMVWQELLCQNHRELNVPTFWVKEKKQSNAEIDFIISWHGHMIPAEVKSGKDRTLRSLHQGSEPELLLCEIELSQASALRASKPYTQLRRTELYE